MVPSGLEGPEIIFPFEVGVDSVFPVIAAPWRHTQVKLDAAQAHRILEEEAVAKHRGYVVPAIGVGEAGNSGICSCETHLLKHIVRSDVVIYIAEIQLRQRLTQQTNLLQGLHVILISLLSVKDHGVGVFHNLAVESHRAHTVPLEFEGEELVRSNFQRCEEAYISIGDHIHLARFKIDLPEIGYTGVIRATDEVFVVKREAELPQV